ncbi:hypothetical protein EDD52_10448 [Primorskyibacter sedentarius]|uniref:Uncharacterized protein n=1 Tax=Primorskyibacter sedentarius TaxID=745311 RepID=A0A4R3JH32_9RHOB|nr:hypothetical protein EDD52_10448 [Primorskyibacter sedentarius]
MPSRRLSRKVALLPAIPVPGLTRDLTAGANQKVPGQARDRYHLLAGGHFDA